MEGRHEVPRFFIYGEPARALDVGFLHVETVMQRRYLHFGHVAPHKHPQMGQITWWHRGGGTYQIEDRTWIFSAPAISFVPSDVVHGFDVDHQSNAVVVSVSDDLLKAIAPQSDLGLDVPTFLTGQSGSPIWAHLGSLLDMVAEEYRERGAARGKVLIGLVGVVLSLMERLGGSTALPSSSPTVTLALSLRRAIDFHYREALPVGHYVELLATTRHLLDKAAREVFGMTVKGLLLERRLLEAKRLLRFTVRPVEDIGREIGLGDPAYFSRFFRRRTGDTPTAWRAQRLIDGRG